MHYQIWWINLCIESDLGNTNWNRHSVCIYNRTVCKGRGEKIRFLKKPPWVVLAKPNLGISSADVFKALDLDDAHHVDTCASC